MADVPPIQIDLPDELVGDRVIVRHWSEPDAAGLWDAIDNSREHLEAWMPWVDRYHNPDDALEYCRRSHARWLLRDDLSVAIIEKSSGRIVGGSGFHRIDWKFRLFEIGYWLREDAEGNGFATETVQLLTRLAFDGLAANRVELRIDTRNIPSLLVAERAGYVLEGTLRRKLPAPDGIAADMHVLALIREEYELLPWATRA